MTFLSLLITIGAYAMGRMMFAYFKYPLANPVLIGTTLLVFFLNLSGLDYNIYTTGTKAITNLLGPATVALAVPLYINKKHIVGSVTRVVSCIFIGTLSTAIAVLWISRLLKLHENIVYSLAPKSVTTPIAMEVSRIIGGDPSLTSAFVIITGIIGAVIGPITLNLLKIKSPLARGLAVGTASHGVGSSMMFEEGQLQGAMGGLAMGIAGISTALVLPWLLTIV